MEQQIYQKYESSRVRIEQELRDELQSEKCNADERAVRGNAGIYAVYLFVSFFQQQGDCPA